MISFRVNSRFALLFSALLVASIACGGDATGPTESVPIVGSWTLIKVNGQGLPSFFTSSGVLTLDAAGKFTEVQNRTSSTSGGSFTLTREGSYTVNGSSVTYAFTSIGILSATGVYTGTSLTLNDGAEWQYKPR